MNKAKKIKQEMQAEYCRWEALKTHGGNDPMWEDGYNMNLVRAHIIDLRFQCEKELLPEEYPEEYNRPIPEYVDDNYMARPDEIRRNAANTLRICLESSVYQYVKANYKVLGMNAEIAMLPVEGLQNMAKHEDLVYMRRYEKPERVLNPLQECKEKIMKLLGEDKKELPEGQLSIFDFM
nr:MAG TPA: hypothetical protein [Caudoviricetes sp.]